MSSIEKIKIGSPKDINSNYSYSFENSINSFKVIDNRFFLNSGNHIPELPYFVLEPVGYIEEINVPIRLSIDNIKIIYKEGTVQVRIKKSVVKYQDEEVDEKVQSYIESKISKKDNGIFKIEYRFGSIMNQPIEIFSQEYIKSSGSWLTPVLAVGLMVVAN